jgi:centrosomal protein CEP104
VQFPSTVRVKLVQILSHEYKVPTEVEMVAITKGGEKSSRLGSFKLQDNASTQFKARELKSVYVEVDCKYLKFILLKAHPNTKNLFSQVAMMSLNIYGEFMEHENEYVRSLKTLDPIKGM